MSITYQQYKTLDDAFSFFNYKLFEGQLPECMITLQRTTSKRTLGYYFPKRFENRDAHEKVDEIALNPDRFAGRNDTEILSTLVHEMVHLWCEIHGSASRDGYHNRAWGEKMEDVGLMPSNTGKPGGKKTGQQMTHWVIEDGPFSVTCAQFVENGSIAYGSFPILKPKKPNSKLKYVCSGGCKQNCWAKPGVSLLCGLCGQVMEVTEELA